jgi:hypothetical protein
MIICYTQSRFYRRKTCLMGEIHKERTEDWKISYEMR